MRPFFINVIDYGGGKVAINEPWFTLSDAADMYGEAEKDNPLAIQTLRFDAVPCDPVDVTAEILALIEARLGKDAA